MECQHQDPRQHEASMEWQHQASLDSRQRFWRCATSWLVVAALVCRRRARNGLPRRWGWLCHQY